MMGIKYEEEIKKRRDVILFHMGAKCGVVRCIMHVIDEHLLMLSMLAPTSVPEAHRTSAAVYLTYCNYGITSGNFELDMDDGELRFRNSSFLMGASLSQEIVEFLVIHSVYMMERYFLALMAVVYGGKDPKEAHQSVVSADEP